MFDTDQYELLDFGNGRKLERFAGTTVDRPCPAAESVGPQGRWTPDLKFERNSKGDEGKWRGAAPEAWRLQHDEVTFQLRNTPFGHVGIFPEQAENWDWIARQMQRCKGAKVLNLFAYTGGSTLAAAAAGADVTHVDAAKNVVAWARNNAAESGLEEAPIRWIHEDARKFVQRELKRGNRYDAVILDPPTYGHGANGEPWRIARDLAPLLMNLAELTEANRQFMLLTCHSPGFGPAEVEALLADCVFGTCQCNARATRAQLLCHDNRRLDCGVAARWPNL